jgi:hypothetical protein
MDFTLHGNVMVLGTAKELTQIGFRIKYIKGMKVI